MALRQYVVGGKNMLHNLMAEIARSGIGRKQMAEAIGISEKALQNKLYARSDFTVPEAIKLRETFFPDKDLNYLFDNNAAEVH